MGEQRPQPESEVEQLQRMANEQLAELKATLDRLDVARARTRGRHATPEQRRRAFRVITGGAVAVAVVTVWECIRRPHVAVASVAGAAGLVAVPVAIDPPPLPPAQSTPPAVVVLWGNEEQVPPRGQGGGDDAPAPVAEEVAEVPDGSVDVQVPEPSAPPPAPEPTTKPEPKPEPVAKATVTAEPTVEPTEPAQVEVEVDADDGAACVESGLVGLELAVCLDAVR